MTTDQAQYGPKLYAYLEAYWRAHGTNRNAWCDQHPGLQAPTVSRWAGGAEPRLPALRAVADALGLATIGELLAACGIDGDQPTEPTPPRIDDALRLDDTVPESARRAMSDMLDAIRAVETGAVDRRRRRR